MMQKIVSFSVDKFHGDIFGSMVDCCEGISVEGVSHSSIANMGIERLINIYSNQRSPSKFSSRPNIAE